MLFEVRGDLSVVETVSELIENAVSYRASDIHLEPSKNCLNVRCRVDGVLIPVGSLSDSVKQQVVSRVKVLANIDISEKRIPQDGKFNFFLLDRTVDLRVSTFPSIYGENVVIRILDSSNQTLSLDELGFEEDVLSLYRDLVSHSSGFFLVTGPTGSGKTTTLYATLSEFKSPEKNIITLEDPVEYNIDGVVQGQVNNQAGFTFAKGMRSLLRQDPDIAMIGEIRDKETAGVAVEAALTGHLVFSTLHTNDAPGAIMRLLDMGVEPFLINASVSGVLAQRLARKLCQNCKKQILPDEHEKTILRRLKLDLKTLWKSSGCQKCCNVGYKGRVGLFELLKMTSNLRSLIIHDPHFDKIHKQAELDGMKTLKEDGLQKVKDGIISMQEFVRVIL
ncbi:type II/IV secretion system protein [bacterium]|jgi:type II secretory ATPase GspE/PulE/Tfp pilus assembly ATPase PilB-like protein|nr:type II/IV secretion system protein [bacterium]